MAALREDAAKRKAGLSPADRTRLSRAAWFGTVDGHPLIPSRADVEAIWRAHGPQLVTEYLRRPTLMHAFAVAELGADRALRRAAAEWLAWRRREPDPRASALDDTPTTALDGFVAWRADEPPHLPTPTT